MAPLIAAAVTLAPIIMEAVAGRRAAQVTERVAAIVKDVTGYDDLKSLEQLPPEQQAELRIRFAALAVEDKRIELEGVANARAQTIALAQAGSSLAWMPAVVSALVLGVWAWTMVAPTIGAIPMDDGDKRIVEWALIAVLGYWIGSSQGSKASGNAVRELAARAALPAPAPPVAIATTGPVTTDSLNDAALAQARGQR